MIDNLHFPSRPYVTPSRWSAKFFQMSHCAPGQIDSAVQEILNKSTHKGDICAPESHDDDNSRDNPTNSTRDFDGITCWMSNKYYVGAGAVEMFHSRTITPTVSPMDPVEIIIEENVQNPPSKPDKPPILYRGMTACEGLGLDLKATTKRIAVQQSRKSKDCWPHPLTPQTYIRKFRGHPDLEFRVRQYKRSELLWTFLAVFVGISLVAAPHEFYFTGQDMSFIVGSFGAMAVLIYATPTSPLAQPRNAFLGHGLSAIIGVTCFKGIYYGLPKWIASSLSVSISIFAMQVTGSLHPPGAATAIIAVLGPPSIHDLGYLYIIVPVEAGVAAMILVAMVINNLSRRKFYPIQWWNKRDQTLVKKVKSVP